MILYILLGILGIGIIGIMVVLWKIYKNLSRITPPKDENLWSKELTKQISDTQLQGEALKEYLQLMREKMDEEVREKRDKDLIEYASKRMKNIPTGGIISSGYQMDEKPVNVHNTKIVVPFGLNNTDRALLEMFYENGDKTP